VWGFLSAPLSLNQAKTGWRDRAGQPIRTRSYLGPGPAGCADRFLGAAVGAPLGEWRGRLVPGSPSRVAGWAALTPQARLLGTWTASFAIQGCGPWSPRAPHFREKPGPPLRAGRALLNSRRAVPGVKADGACRAVACWLHWGCTLFHVSARRVENRSPRPCLARRAYWTGRGPFPLPLTGRFSTGARAHSHLASGRPWRDETCIHLFGAFERCIGGRARVRWGRVPGRSCPADRVR
jgi:hypothetical protein